MPVSACVKSFGVGALLLPVVVASSQPAVAVAPSAYTVPAGAEVVEVVLLGGQGGSTLQYGFGIGGKACKVTVALPVSPGDSVTWVLGSDGESTTAITNVTMGGRGGTGARPGGNGGDLANNSNGDGYPGAGGGAASAAYLNADEVVVAAGGGGAAAGTSGGSGCTGNGSGSQGFGTVTTSRGGVTTSAGGLGGTGESGSAPAPYPGIDGNSATGTPAGKGGDGGQSCIGCNTSISGGRAGGGGGGGLSGGGGGAGTKRADGIGRGSGASGLSGVASSVVQAGLAAPLYQTGTAVPSFLAVNVVEISTTQLPAGSVGAPYSASLQAVFREVFSTTSSAGTPSGDVDWAVAAGSPALPAGLSLATTGAITGTPTAGGPVQVVFEARVLDWFQLVRARSVVTLTLDVAGSSSTPAESLVTTPVNPSTTTPSTTTEPTTPPVPTTAEPTPATSAVPTGDGPAPVRINDALPELPAGDVSVVEDGEPVEVDVYAEDDTLVLESDRFELRLKGDCTRDACLIDTTDEGREILTLEEAGRANVDGLGFLPGSQVDIWLFSEPRYLGSLTVADDGTFIGDVDLLNIAVGEHTLQVNGTSQTGAQRSANLGVIVNPRDVVLPATGDDGDRAVSLGLLLLVGGVLVLAARRRLVV